MANVINKIKCLINGHNFIASGNRIINGENEIGKFYTEDFSCACGKTINCKQIESSEQQAKILFNRIYKLNN